jgi:Xaa-Pro aminopeptidase
MTTLLIYGAPGLSADLFHAVPTGIIDPFLYLESNGRRAATVSQLDADKVSSLGIEILDPYDLGADELLALGITRHEVDLELSKRACERMGVGRAIVPPEFPVGLADHLRASGIELFVDPEPFVNRRRVKTESEIEGIRRAQRAADEAMGVAARLIRALRSPARRCVPRCRRCATGTAATSPTMRSSRTARNRRSVTSGATGRSARARSWSSTSGRVIARPAAGPT